MAYRNTHSSHALDTSQSQETKAEKPAKVKETQMALKRSLTAAEEGASKLAKFSGGPVALPAALPQAPVHKFNGPAAVGG